jgi:hypothetical protein
MPRLVLCTGAGRVFHDLKSLSRCCWRDGSQPWNLQAGFTFANAAGFKLSSAGVAIAVRFIVLTTALKQPAVKRYGHRVGVINRAQKDASNMPHALTVIGSAEIK